MDSAASTPLSPRTAADSAGVASKPHPSKPQANAADAAAVAAAAQLPPLDRSPAPVRPQDHSLPTPSSSDPGQPLKPNACISCQRRKVKCDRQEPCSSCKRYRAHCEFRDPAPRRKRKLSDEDLHAKLDRYESILNRFGARVDARPDPALAERPASAALPTPVSAFTPLNAPRPPQPAQSTHEPSPVRSATAAVSNSFEGKLIYDKGSSRYLENSLWKGISEEFKSAEDMLRLASPASNSAASAPADSYPLEASELVLGLVPNPAGGLRNLHPQSPHIFLLWQAFLDNVNPLLKILHAPTVQRQILKAASNLDAVDAETEVLMFAIYTFAVTSLSHEECQSTFGESKEGLLRKFQFASKIALHRAGFLRSSSLVVLQAYMLYLLAMRPYYDIQTLWSLSAIAVRIGQRIGLHRDGSKMGLPLFDIEMRRRIWWQLMPLDIRTAELAGGSATLFSRGVDTALPLNVNDSELNPDMKQLPVEHTGPTEMFFCLLRYNLGRFMSRSTAQNYFGNTQTKVFGDDLPNIMGSEASLAEKDRKINEFEQYLEEHFLKHCDPSVPLHYITAIVARCALSVMRVMAHHPRQYADKGKSLPQSERDFLFQSSLKLVELDNLAHGDPSLHRYLWHMDAFFQWDCFIFLLSELRSRTSPTDKEVEKAWFNVSKIFEFHPDMLDIGRNPLHLAVGSLVMKAWDAYVAEALRLHRPAPSLQDHKALEVLVSRLRDMQSRSPPGGPHGGQQSSTSSTVAGPRGPDDGSVAGIGEGAKPWNVPVHAQIDSSPLDWDMWDDMMAEFGLGQEAFGSYLAGSAGVN
ncbi:hypothetical protein MPH_09979 [Macrophomina phaseolina MS6]|uniref:Zn(2)-C6 fungal-type domain-containing protein n=1 Tax=Macrophomina phaseolina (strain MS6) TaxID=1126212 RepID=K2S7N5_MACPH|nr:hypothetical protein MPH_09979 [Macrophomina phaseolina MS6]